MSLEISPCHSELASGLPSINRLRPYQREVALAILDSVFGRKGFTFSVEITTHNPPSLAFGMLSSSVERHYPIPVDMMLSIPFSKSLVCPLYHFLCN